MSDFSSFHAVPQKLLSQRQHLDNAHFSTSQFLTSRGLSFPLLGLPSSITTNSWLMGANDGKTIIELPEASKLLTQCYKQCQLIYFNLKFLQFIVAEPSYRTSLGIRIDLDAIILLYLSLSGNGSIGFGGEVTTFGRETIRQTLANYLGEEYYSPFFSE